MLLCNFEVRINTERTGQRLTESELEDLTKEVSAHFYRMIEALNQDDRIHISVTEV